MDVYDHIGFGSAVKGEISGRDSKDAVTWQGYKPCGSDTEWSHKNQFYEQERFFTFLDLLSTAPKEDNSDFKGYGHLMQPGAAEVYPMRILTQTGANLQIQNGQLKWALKQIADKTKKISKRRPR